MNCIYLQQPTAHYCEERNDLKRIFLECQPWLFESKMNSLYVVSTHGHCFFCGVLMSTAEEKHSFSKMCILKDLWTFSGNWWFSVQPFEQKLILKLMSNWLWLKTFMIILLKFLKILVSSNGKKHTNALINEYTSKYTMLFFIH